METIANFPTEAGDAPAEATPSERLLLDAARAGNREAAEELVDRTYSAVYASLYRLCGDGDLAADLTQDCYQKAWAALRTFDGRAQFFTWLYRIAYTTFLNHIRRPRRIVQLEEPHAVALRDDAPRVDEVLAADEEAERLRAAVLQLPDDLRFTVTAHFWGGLAVREIATAEKITTVAVRKRLHRAFTILEAALDEVLR